MSNKKAQFYIIAAIIIIVVLVSIGASVNYILSKDREIKVYDLSEEFSKETASVIDYSVISGTDIENNTKDFVDKYLEYTQEKEPGTELVFVYGNTSDVFVVSYTNLTIEESSVISLVIGSPLKLNVGQKLQKKEEKLKPTGNRIDVKIVNSIYSFNLTQEENFIFVIKKEIGEERYVSGA